MCEEEYFEEGINTPEKPWVKKCVKDTEDFMEEYAEEFCDEECGDELLEWEEEGNCDGNKSTQCQQKEKKCEKKCVKDFFHPPTPGFDLEEAEEFCAEGCDEECEEECSSSEEEECELLCVEFFEESWEEEGDDCNDGLKFAVEEEGEDNEEEEEMEEALEFMSDFFTGLLSYTDPFQNIVVKVDAKCFPQVVQTNFMAFGTFVGSLEEIDWMNETPNMFVQSATAPLQALQTALVGIVGSGCDAVQSIESAKGLNKVIGNLTKYTQNPNLLTEMAENAGYIMSDIMQIKTDCQYGGYNCGYDCGMLITDMEPSSNQ